MTKPNIPSIPSSVDSRVRQALESLRIYFRSVEQRGGLASVDQITSGELSIPSNAISQDRVPVYFKPENLVAISAIGAVMLRWNANLVGGIAYTEVLRAELDDFSSAVAVAQVNGFSHTDYPTTNPVGKTFYYWIRFVGLDGSPGPANAVAGTPGTATADPSYTLSLIQGQVLESHLATTLTQRIDKIEINEGAIGGISTQYTVKIDNNGFITGYGLASEIVDGVPFSEFMVNANRFAIIDPNGTVVNISSLTQSAGLATAKTATAHGYSTGDTVAVTFAQPAEYNGTHEITVNSSTSFSYPVQNSPVSPATAVSGKQITTTKTVVPFVVQGGQTYINSAIIGNAVIGSAQIKNAAINDAHIDILNADKIKTGTLEGITVKTTDPVTGRYSLLEGGDLSFYRGGVQTKYLKEILAGSANSNTPVTVALDRAPQVQVSIRDLRAYDVNYANQNQRWVCRLLNDLVTNNGNGTYTFTPVCQLTLDAGAATEQLSYTYSSATDTYTSSTKTSPASTSKITVSGNVNSTRGTGASPSYYRRQAVARLYYRVSPSGAWSSVSTTVDHGADFSPDNFSVATGTLTASSYDYYIQITWSDTGATFTSGTTVYETATDNVSNTGSGTLASCEITSSTSQVTNSASGLLQLPSYTVPSGWTIDKVDYTAEYAYSLVAQVNSGGTRATAQVAGPGGVSHFLEQYFAGSKSQGNIASYQGVSWSSASYNRDVEYSGSVMANVSAYAQAGVIYRNATATITRKRPEANTTTPNNTAFVDSASFDLNQAQIIDGTGVVNWIAIA